MHDVVLDVGFLEFVELCEHRQYNNHKQHRHRNQSPSHPLGHFLVVRVIPGVKDQVDYVEHKDGEGNQTPKEKGASAGLLCGAVVSRDVFHFGRKFNMHNIHQPTNVDENEVGHELK